METFWFIVVALTLTVYVVLKGFDLGAGIIHHVAANTEAERRVILRAIGPVWDGNQVWLIAAGGTLFLSFPVRQSGARHYLEDFFTFRAFACEVAGTVGWNTDAHVRLP